MKRATWMIGLLVGACAIVPTIASARGFGVEVWTDRGNDAVYQPGDVMQLRVRATDDSYLLVYEIDAEGYVRVLFPYEGSNGLVDGRRTYHVPADDANVELVVQKSTGQGYVVALASHQPFVNLPWYLRPYNEQADEVGYVNQPNDDEDGVADDGRIVGDPYVAMERIRRTVLRDPAADDEFATAYTSYYVHEQVRYPRYICYDCHRPNRWAWWDGFDPYYTHCSVVDFRVNWSWNWGPTCWNGFVPYYVYVMRNDCPPRWRYSGPWLSSWDGWNRWNQLWGGPLSRHKSPPPPGYVPPSKYANWRGGATSPPPGFLVTNNTKWRNIPGGIAVGRGSEVPREPGSGRIGAQRPGVFREPVRQAPPDEDRPRQIGEERRPSARPMPAERPRDEGGRGETPRIERRYERPAPQGQPREESPRMERRGEERPAPASRPREEAPRVERRPEERPAPASPPREERAPREERPQRNDPPRQERAPREERPQRNDPPQQEARHDSPARPDARGEGHARSRGEP